MFRSAAVLSLCRALLGYCSVLQLLISMRDLTPEFKLSGTHGHELLVESTGPREGDTDFEDLIISRRSQLATAVWAKSAFALRTFDDAKVEAKRRSTPFQS